MFWSTPPANPIKQEDERQFEEVIEQPRRSDAEEIPRRRDPGRPTVVRTGRRGRPRKQYNENGMFVTPETPISQAVIGPGGELWKDVIYEEVKCLVNNETWDIVDRPKDAKVIGCRTVL